VLASMAAFPDSIDLQRRACAPGPDPRGAPEHGSCAQSLTPSRARACRCTTLFNMQRGEGPLAAQLARKQQPPFDRDLPCAFRAAAAAACRAAPRDPEKHGDPATLGLALRLLGAMAKTRKGKVGGAATRRDPPNPTRPIAHNALSDHVRTNKGRPRGRSGGARSSRCGARRRCGTFPWTSWRGARRTTPPRGQTRARHGAPCAIGRAAGSSDCPPSY